MKERGAYGMSVRPAGGSVRNLGGPVNAVKETR